MAQSGNIANRITDLIGSQYSTDAAYSGDLINSAINEIADLLSLETLLKHSRTPGVLESNSEWLVEGRKILKVTRIDADSNGIERECLYVDRQDFQKASDSGSISYATAYSPVFHMDSANAGAATLKILPEPTTPQKGKIWYFSYASGTSPDSNIEDLTESTLNNSLFLPPETMHAIVLKSCINILDAYISNQIQDEEDMELLGMVTQQKQGLEARFQAEIQRFVEPDEQGGAG